MEMKAAEMNWSVATETFTNYDMSVRRCMAAASASTLLTDNRPVMLKPNLVNDSPHPVTTPPAFCAAVIAFVRQHTEAPIVIAEGSGDARLSTPEIFATLGYVELARRWDVELLDLNEAKLGRRTDESCRLFPHMWLPKTVFTHVLISLPVLKAHSLCRFTGGSHRAPPR